MDDLVKFDSLKIIIQIIGKMYDLVRIIDPSKKTIVLFSQEGENKLNFTNAACYSMWHKGKACENCISTRALNENKAMVKIEYDQGRVFLINAFPVEVQGEKIVVEMFKDITENGIIDIKADTNDAGEIERVINRRNRAIVEDDLTRVYNKRYIYERLP